MQKKNWLKIIISLTLLIGGVMAFFSLNGEDWEVKNKVTLTRKQQDNIVKRIARNYQIDSVEFLNMEKNNATGSYNIIFKVNKYPINNILQVEDLLSLNDYNGVVALDPVEDFKKIQKSSEFDYHKEIDISNIKIIYLKE